MFRLFPDFLLLRKRTNPAAQCTLSVADDSSLLVNNQPVVGNTVNGNWLISRANGRANHVPNNDGYAIQSYSNTGTPKPVQFTATNDSNGTMTIDIAHRRVNIGAVGYFELPTSTLSVQGTIDTPQITCRPTDTMLGIGNDSRVAPKTINIGTSRDSVSIVADSISMTSVGNSTYFDGICQGGVYSGWWNVNTAGTPDYQSGSRRWFDPTNGGTPPVRWSYNGKDRFYNSLGELMNGSTESDIYTNSADGTTKFWMNVYGMDVNRIIDSEIRVAPIPGQTFASTDIFYTNGTIDPRPTDPRGIYTGAMFVVQWNTTSALAARVYIKFTYK